MCETTNILKILLICLSNCQFKSFVLAKKITEYFLKINGKLSTFSVSLKPRILLKRVLYNILLVLCDPVVGIRAFLKDPKNEKCLYEDVPIETHLMEIFKLISGDQVDLWSDFETQYLRVSLFRVLTSHEIGVNLLLQVIDKFKLKFDFVETLKEQNLFQIFQKNQKIFRFLLFEIFKTLGNFVPIKSGEQFKCILAVLNKESVDVGENPKEMASELKNTLKAIFLGNEIFLDVKKSIISKTIKHIIKILNLEISANSQMLKNLLKRSKLVAKNIMPDLISNRLVLISKFPKNKAFILDRLVPALKNMDLFNLSNSIKEIFNKNITKRSFLVEINVHTDFKMNDPIISINEIQMGLKSNSFSENYAKMLQFTFLSKAEKNKPPRKINREMEAEILIYLPQKTKTNLQFEQKMEQEQKGNEEVAQISHFADSQFKPPNPFLNQRVTGQVDFRNQTRAPISSINFGGRLNASQVQIMKNQIINSRQKMATELSTIAADLNDSFFGQKRPEMNDEFDNQAQNNVYNNRMGSNRINQVEIPVRTNTYNNPSQFQMPAKDSNDLINLLKVETEFVQSEKKYQQKYPPHYCQNAQYNESGMGNMAPVQPFQPYGQMGYTEQGGYPQQTYGLPIGGYYPQHSNYPPGQLSHSQGRLHAPTYRMSPNRPDNVYSPVGLVESKIVEGEFSDDEIVGKGSGKKVKIDSGLGFDLPDDRTIDTKNQEFLSLLGKKQRK